MQIQENTRTGYEAVHPNYDFSGYGMTREAARNDLEEKLSIASTIRREKETARPNESRVFQIDQPHCRFDYGCVTSDFVALGQSPDSARQNLFEIESNF